MNQSTSLRHQLTRKYGKYPGALRINSFSRRHGPAVLHVDVKAILPGLFEFVAFSLVQDFPDHIFAQHAIQPGVYRSLGNHADEVLGGGSARQHRPVGQRAAHHYKEILGEARDFSDPFNDENGKEGGKWIAKRMEPASASPKLLDMRKESFCIVRRKAKKVAPDRSKGCVLNA